MIESKQDVSERKDTSFGGSVTVGIGPAGVTLKDLSINGSKGKGEEEWVDKQTTLIAKNGGIIKAENKLTNTGGVIASLSENEKLKVSANEIEVGNLEDKNKYENVGGGISVGFDNGKVKIPKISVLHDKIDKEQINRASAINTEFTIAGKEKTAEDLGFNTDLSKVQETTKDNEKHLNADLHTDLLNKVERDKVVSAGRKIKAGVEAIASPNESGRINTFKEGLVGIYFDEYREKNQEAFNLLKDETISNNQKVQILRTLQKDFYKEHGYEGVLPEISLTDGYSSFAVDSKNSADGKERIFISIHHLNDPNTSIASIFGHETGHLNTYDSGEETANYLQSKVGKNDKNKQFTKDEKEKYLKSLDKDLYPSLSEKEQFEIANNVPLKDRENWGIEVFTSETFAFGARFSRTQSFLTLMNKEKEEVTTYNIGSTSIGFGTLDIGITSGVGLYFDDKVEELSLLSNSLGGSFTVGTISLGGDLLFRKNSAVPRGVRVYIGKGLPNPIPLETHYTFIEIGRLQNIKKDRKAYKIIDDFLKNSSVNGGEL